MTFECSHSLCAKCWKSEEDRQRNLGGKRSNKRKRETPPFKCPTCMTLAKKPPIRSVSLENIAKDFSLIKSKLDAKRAAEKADEEISQSADDQKGPASASSNQNKRKPTASDEPKSEDAAADKSELKGRNEKRSSSSSSTRERSASSRRPRSEHVAASKKSDDNGSRIRKGNPVTASRPAKKQRVTAPPKQSSERKSESPSRLLRRAASVGSDTASDRGPGQLRRSKSMDLLDAKDDDGSNVTVNVGITLERSKRQEKLGAKISAKNPKAHHSYIAFQGVEKGKPAYRAGIREHDHLVKVNGVMVNGYRDFQKIVSMLVTHLRVRLVVRRRVSQAEIDGGFKPS